MKQANLGLNATQLAEHQVWLHQQADVLIDQLHLLDIARYAGHPRVVGSYELGLMVWPDLDVEILTPGEPDRGRALELVNRLMRDAGVTKLNISDTRQTSDPDIPQGIYIGPDVVHNGLAWQIDLWMFDRDVAAQRRQLVGGFRAKLNDATRTSILRIKQIAAASDRYHRGVSSVDIYTAVLEQGVTDIAGFEAYLRQTGRSL